MKNKTVTDWFGLNVNPSIIGVYELRPGPENHYEDQSFYCFWNGAHWCGAAFSVGYAELLSRMENGHTWGLIPGWYNGWRGLVENPELA
jgi:hypothetical protein